MNAPRIVTVVLNTNRRDDTLACLQALAHSTYPNLGVMVLDNGSTDGSPEAVRAHCPDVQVVPLADNLGYAGNNNVGIRWAVAQGAEWVFVLNEDTLVEPDCLTRLVEAAQRNPALGVLGPMVYTFDEEPRVSSAGGFVHWVGADAVNVGMGDLDRGQYPARSVDFINGCGLLVSRSAVQQAGGLDDSFFIYWEETDWCQRIKKAGFGLWFEPAARMRHKAPIHHSSFGPSTFYYMTRNRLRFFARHTPWPLWPLTMYRAWAGALRGIRQHQREGRPEHARAMQWAIRHARARHWGKADATLWKSDASDRALHSAAKPPAA